MCYFQQIKIHLYVRRLMLFFISQYVYQFPPLKKKSSTIVAKYLFNQLIKSYIIKIY